MERGNRQNNTMINTALGKLETLRLTINLLEDSEHCTELYGVVA